MAAARLTDSRSAVSVAHGFDRKEPEGDAGGSRVPQKVSCRGGGAAGCLGGQCGRPSPGGSTVCGSPTGRGQGATEANWVGGLVSWSRSPRGAGSTPPHPKHFHAGLGREQMPRPMPPRLPGSRRGQPGRRSLLEEAVETSASHHSDTHGSRSDVSPSRRREAEAGLLQGPRLSTPCTQLPAQLLGVSGVAPPSPSAPGYPAPQEPLPWLASEQPWLRAWLRGFPGQNPWSTPPIPGSGRLVSQGRVLIPGQSWEAARAGWGGHHGDLGAVRRACALCAL